MVGLSYGAYCSNILKLYMSGKRFIMGTMYTSVRNEDVYFSNGHYTAFIQHKDSTITISHKLDGVPVEWKTYSYNTMNEFASCMTEIWARITALGNKYNKPIEKKISDIVVYGKCELTESMRNFLADKKEWTYIDDGMGAKIVYNDGISTYTIPIVGEGDEECNKKSIWCTLHFDNYFFSPTSSSYLHEKDGVVTKKKFY